MKFDDEKSVVRQLYDRYLDSALVHSTEDVLTIWDIAEVVRQRNITKADWNDHAHIRRWFWERVGDLHFEKL